MRPLLLLSILLACDPSEEVSLRDAPPQGCYFGPVDNSFAVSACVVHTITCMAWMVEPIDDDTNWCDSNEAECFEAMVGCVNSGMECAKKNLGD